MPSDYQQNIQNFIQKIKAVLEADGFHKIPQSVLIVVGQPDCGKLIQIRIKHPPPILIFYIYKHFSQQEEENFLRKADELRVLAAPLLAREHFADKVGVLVSLFPNRPRQLIVERELEESCTKDVEQVKMAIEIAVEMNSQILMRGLVWMRSALGNLGFILKQGSSVRQLPEFKDPPVAVLCGAGPSLVHHFEFLKNMQEKFFLISVGHAFPMLWKAGIIPDVVLEIDSYVERNWAGFSSEIPDKTLLVATPDVATEVPPLFKKHLWISAGYAVINEWFKWYGIPLLPLHTDKTVSIVALDFAVKAGIKRIILLGQDMALNEDNRFYLDDSPLNTIEPLTFVDGYEGSKVAATDGLISLRKSMELYLAELALCNPDVEIINCTSRGAIIHGTKRDSIENVIKDCSGEGSGRLQCDWVELPIRRDVVAAKLSAQKDIFDKAIEKAEKVVKRCDEFKSNIPHGGEQIALLNKALLEEHMLRQSREAINFIMPIFQNISFLQDAMCVRGQKDIFEQALATRTLYSFFKDLLTDFKADIEQVIEKNSFSGRIRNPKIFKAFYNYATDFVSKKNPDLGKWLKQNLAFEYDQKKFSVQWQHQYLPYVLLKDGADSWVALSSSNVAHWGDEVVQNFVKENKYDPLKDAVVFWMGGNWAHICAFCRNFTDASFLVIEPYLELFSHIITRGMFLHFFPTNTLIVGLHNDIATALPLYAKELAKWQKERKRILVFKHPVLGDKIPLPAEFVLCLKSK
jgi:hypothetical protein